MSRALVCVSGGVDSTAALLRCTGRFTGVRAVFVDTRGAGPPSQAVETCRRLAVELMVIPAADEFSRQVSGPSLEMLKKGLTPNPCAMCNAGVKLALPFRELEEGELLVTGHYARCRNGVLSRGCDPGKDQSYFLSMVPGKILGRCFFPLEASLKSQVLLEVASSGLPHLSRESQDLCFTLDPAGEEGDLVDTEGNVIGRHKGLGRYTPGQRKGIGAHGQRRYVVRLDRPGNRVVIGGRESLYSTRCLLNSINWLGKPPGDSFQCKVQIRYRKPAVPARATLEGDGVQVVFMEPQRSVSPGQVGALYINDSVLCGGLISDFGEV